MDLYRAKYSDKKSNRYSKTNNSSSGTFRNNSPSRSYRNSNDDMYSRDRYSRDGQRREMHKVICADCGNECSIPFEPKFNRPVYCSDCFRKKDSKSNERQFSRNSRSTYKKDFNRKHDSNSNHDNSIKRNPKTDRFLKKRDDFYSNGSEKFYASVKEKLFEILGGKICSKCGFKDERALGFHHVKDENAFDSIRRGGFASSWGKYVSEPELARSELKVLCLNCNEIQQINPKSVSDDSTITKKKSRRFPR